MSPIVKVCGITNHDDALLAIDQGASLLGLIFADSPRRVSLAVAERILDNLPEGALRVGVFSTPDDPKINEVSSRLPLDLLQIYFATGREVDYAYTVPVLAAFLVNGPADLAIGRSFALYDFKKNPALLDTVAGHLPLEKALLAGGLNSDNVAGVIDRLSPLGVDVCSGVESSPGVKDRRKLQSFMKAVGA